ncbi:unnamed protein product [Coffea canephora]|uniref:Uncharacterized protein n=1 Tax=Coffea canephora TaxID=49390 RepID=A0A068UUP9_COFCA|nr:unnamed protein product [Coffea canephora]
MCSRRLRRRRPGSRFGRRVRRMMGPMLLEVEPMVAARAILTAKGEQEQLEAEGCLSRLKKEFFEFISRNCIIIAV